MAKRWKKQEITYLRRYADRNHVAALAERFKTDLSTVQTKLHELGLTALDSVEPSPLETNPLVDELERGLKLLHQGKWEQAAKLFERVQAKTGQAELVRAARRYLAICRERLGQSDRPEADPYALAVFERNRGNLEEAQAICAAGGRRSKDPRFAYLAASLYARQDDLEEAARFLRTAYELDASNRVHARMDSDFEVLREQPEHRQLFEG